MTDGGPVPALREADVCILGAGPAGCAAALNLARLCKVVLIDREVEPKPRAGESLPPAANALLRDMGLLESFRQQGHSPCFANRFCWGQSDWQESDFLRDPQGHGWHLDRPLFERGLRQQAKVRGARFLLGARLETVQRCPEIGGWRVTVDGPQGLETVLARVVLDAAGRTPVLAKAQGAVREQQDKLVCSWLLGGSGGSGASGAETNAGIGVSTIWACETGWWYSAPLPQQQRILAFYTDADLPVAKHVRDAGGLLATARAHPPLSGLDPAFPLQAWLAALTENGFSFGFTAANSAQTCPPVGPGWLCAGDAALSFDPLSAQGIFNALYTGLAAAESIYRYLQNDIHDFSEYAAHLQQIRASYQQHLRQWYGAEQRWADAPFWQRRHMGN